MIPKPLARRLDRLARRAHAFHRWAHHPLCAEYEGEVIRLGRKIRLCRGCALAALGGAAGTAAGLLLHPGPRILAAGMVLGLAAAALLVRGLPRRKPRAGRRSKVPTRFLPAALAGFGLAGGLRSGTVLGLLAAAAAAAGVAAVVRAYRKARPQRFPCEACPERNGPVPCRGFREIWVREKAFTRLSGRLLASELTPPLPPGR